MRVRLLGDFSIALDGSVIGGADFGRRSGAHLVQLLALSPGRRRHREQIFDALWPDVSIETAANRLYQAASHARKALASADAIVVRDQVVALLPDRVVRVDVDLIESVDPDDADRRTEALAAWGGELLADSPYAEWAEEHRERVRRRYVQLLAAAGRWHTIIELDPTSEDAHLVLMRQSLEAGDHHGALQRFEVLTQALTDELGVPPGAAAVALRDEAERLLVSPRSDVQAPGLRAFVVAMADEPGGDDRSVADVIEAAGGSVLEQGPGAVTAAFASAVGALGAAVEVQRAAEHDLGSAYRLAVDIGEAEPSDDGWSGDAIDRAGAIAAAASGGQIICSSLVAAFVRSEPRLGTQTVDLGLYRLPDQAPVSLHRVVVEGLADRTTALRARRVAGRPIEPIDDTIFGREAAIEALGRELEEARLVTIVGPGGGGKTHLASHVGNLIGRHFSGGAWFCELARVSDPNAVHQQVLMAIGGQRHTDSTVDESIFRALADRETLLLIDNCEHVLTPTAELCQQILERCPGVQILATSRQPLAIRHEVAFPLPELDRAAAVDLFVAEAAKHGAEPDRSDPIIDRICRRLDDLPLAVRLAAARTPVLSLSALDALLDDRLAFPSVEREGPTRHQTLRSVIAWSVDTLGPAQLGVLVDLSVFADRFSLDGAVAVARRPGTSPGQVLDHFDELTRRSLVSGPHRGDGDAGYRLLESVRLYARELVTDRSAADRHLAYLADRVERSQSMERELPEQSHRRIRADWDDVRIARTHAVNSGRFDTAARLLAGVASAAAENIRFEYLQWCEDAGLDQRAILTEAHARAVAGMAFLTGVRGDLDIAGRLAADAQAASPDDDLAIWASAWVAIFGDTDRSVARRHLEKLVADRTGTAGTWRSSALVVLVIFELVQGDDPQVWLDRLAALASIGPPYEASHLLGLGRSLMASDPEGSLQAFEEALAIAERHELRNSIAGAHSAIPLVAAPIGRVLDALRTVHHSLLWYSETGQWTVAMTVVPAVALALERAGRDDIATTILATREASHLAKGVSYPERLDQIRGLQDRNPDLFPAWWATGERLNPAAATALALATIDAALVGF